jgi:hypothetical protein
MSPPRGCVRALDARKIQKLRVFSDIFHIPLNSLSFKPGAGPTPREFESAAIAERIGQGSSSSSSTCSNDGSLPPPFPPLKVHEVGAGCV